MRYVKWVFMTAAVVCMVMATLHYEQPERNEGITWFWGAWTLAFGWWAIDAARRRNAVFFLAFVAMLMGMDSIRGRLDLFPDVIDSAGNGPSVWFVRIAMGWVAVIYIATRSRSIAAID
jgi:hypothetical protein